jgi:hypothetical protein
MSTRLPAVPSASARRRPPLLPTLGAVFALVAACAHSPPRGDASSLKKAAEAFHQRVRWKDLAGAIELLVPERRQPFEDGYRARRDEHDLSITDYELEDLRVAADGQSAVVVSRLSWMRLPSVSVETETVRSSYVFRHGAWWLEQQDRGPFAKELGPEKKPPAVSGPAEATGVGNPPMGSPTTH